MSTVTENDLKELKELINLRFGQIDSKFAHIDSRFDRIENKIDNLTQDVNDVKIQLTKTQESINGLDTRVKNLEFANRGIFISVTAGILLTGLGALIKFLFFTNLNI
jgi:archaellum component FlaC